MDLWRGLPIIALEHLVWMEEKIKMPTPEPTRLCLMTLTTSPLSPVTIPPTSIPQTCDLCGAIQKMGHYALEFEELFEEHSVSSFTVACSLNIIEHKVYMQLGMHEDHLQWHRRPWMAVKEPEQTSNLQKQPVQRTKCGMVRQSSGQHDPISQEDESSEEITYAPHEKDS